MINHQTTSTNIDALNEISVSVVTPTYKEVDNLPRLCRRLKNIAAQFKAFECIIVDDNSRDGTQELVRSMQSMYPWLKLITREHERGLSTAVITGFENAQNDCLVCIDADLSHPVEMIPQLVMLLKNSKADFVIGSRFVENAKIHSGWNWFRQLNSNLGIFLARIFVKAKDPMAGFFCLTRQRFLSADRLSPIGYKIGLELMVKCRCRNIVEVPIHFSERYKGHSKLSLKEQLNYLRHIGRLLLYKFGLKK